MKVIVERLYCNSLNVVKVKNIKGTFMHSQSYRLLFQRKVRQYIILFFVVLVHPRRNIVFRASSLISGVERSEI